MIYYLVLAYRKEKDLEYKRDLHPSYLTSYNLKLGGSQFGLQSGIFDALKFETIECANVFKEYAVERFGDKYDFDVAPYTDEMFGKYKINYIVPFDYNNDFYYLIRAYEKGDDYMQYLCVDDKVEGHIVNSLKFENKADAEDKLKALNNEDYEFSVVAYNKKYFGKEVPKNVIKAS